MIPSLADMLMGNQPVTASCNKKSEQNKQKKERLFGTPATQQSYEARRNDFCATPGCMNKRHIARTGRCHTTLCSSCYREKNRRFMR